MLFLLFLFGMAGCRLTGTDIDENL